MRNRIAVTVVVAAIALVGCSSSPTPEATDAGTDLAVTTTVVEMTTVVPEPQTTLPVETTIPQASTPVAPVATTPPATTAPKKPSTTTKAPTSTQVPQLQLTGTPQEQANQVVAALTKVAAQNDFGSWSKQLYELKQAVAAYGVTIEADPGTRIYTISMGGQRACFLWTYKDLETNDKHLAPHPC